MQQDSRTHHHRAETLAVEQKRYVYMIVYKEYEFTLMVCDNTVSMKNVRCKHPAMPDNYRV